MNIMISAYLDNNIGDDLMLKLLAARFPQHRFLLYTDKSVVANTFKDTTNIDIRKNRDWEADLDKADAYLSIGGSIFQVVNRSQKLWRIKRIRRLAKVKRHHKKIATLGSNFGPYSDKWGARLTEWELRKNDLVTVRDREALAFLDTFKGVKNYHLADDIVYNLPVDGLLKGASRSGLGISVYRSTRPGEINYQNYQALAGLADAYIRKTRKKVMLFPFDSERENDLAAAHHILDLAQEKNGIEIVPYLGDDAYFLDRFSSCDVMVAIRFHSAILADICQLAFLPVIYSNKMENFLKDRDYQGISIKLEDLTKDLDLDWLADEMIGASRLFNNFTGDRHKAALHFDQLEDLLNRP